MASTSGSKKRKFEEISDIGRTSELNLENIGRTSELNLETDESGRVRSSLDELNSGTDESGRVRSSLHGLDRQCKKSIKTRCSPNRFVNLCTKLKDEFLAAVKGMGFSSLLEMHSCSINLPLVLWLIENFNVENASLSIHGKSFILTPSSFEMVMGVKDGGEDFEQKGSDVDVKRRSDQVKDGSAKLLLAQLEKSLINSESMDDLFVHRFVLFTVKTLLMPTAAFFVGTSILKSIDGFESVRKKNWATKSFTHLVDAIRLFKRNKGAFVGGCMLFLQVFYLHHLEGHNQDIDRSILPIAAWTEKKSKGAIKWIKEGFSHRSKNIQMEDKSSKRQSMNNDVIQMMMKINKCASEIQELKQIVTGLRQSIWEDVEKKVSKMMMDFVETFKSDQGGAAGECGGVRNVSNHINALDDDESERAFQSQNMQSSDVRLQADSITMYKNFVSSGGHRIGPFELTELLSDSDLKIALYIFDETLNRSEVMVEFDGRKLNRSELQCLIPKSPVSDKVIDAYVNLLNIGSGLAPEILDNRECWFLPSSISVLASHAQLELEAMAESTELHNISVDMRRNYFGDLSKCTKIVIPVLIMNEFHWLTAVVNLMEQNVVLWDSMAGPQEMHGGEEIVMKILYILDHLLSADIAIAFSHGLRFQSFAVSHKSFVQQQNNKEDTGIYTAKCMWAASKGLDGILEFDPVDSRLQLAVELVQSELNAGFLHVWALSTSHFDMMHKREREAESGGLLSSPKAN